MRSGHILPIVLVVALHAHFVGKAAAKEPLKPREIIERGIEAQGGEKQVAKLLGPWRAKIKGTAGPLSISGSLAHQSPERGRIETKMDFLGVPTVVIATFDGKSAWQSINGVTREVTGDELKEMKDGGWRSRQVRFLLPVLKDPNCSLSLLDESKVSGRPAVGVRVKSPGHRDIDLYFDNATRLLAKTESRAPGRDKREHVLEQVFSDYKDFGGVKLATKFTKYDNGKETSVEEITELTFVESIDEREYSKP